MQEREGTSGGVFPLRHLLEKNACIAKERVPGENVFDGSTRSKSQYGKREGRMGKLSLAQGCQNSLTAVSGLDNRVPSAPYSSVR